MKPCNPTKRATLLTLLTMAGSMTSCFVPCVWAQSEASEVDTIVISASRGAPQKAKDTPASIDVISAEVIQTGQLQVNISETLSRVPGLIAQNRQNYAQDIQISSRGFGARSAFGVRGLRLYTDGIPASWPDGQGQMSHFDLSSAERIEVLRGPFSSLYGSSSGGVISIFTADGGPKNVAELSSVQGSFGTTRTGARISGQEGIAQYNISAADFATNGYRDHSAVERKNFNGKVRLNLSDDTKLSFVLNDVNMPSAQDPLGLTLSQMQANPRQTGVIAALNGQPQNTATGMNTRKSVDQLQFGTLLEQRINPDLRLQATAYMGQRSTQQFQGLQSTASPQLGTTGAGSTTGPGAVINLANTYQGLDVRLIQKLRLLGNPLTLTYGASTDALAQHRTGYLNYIGTAYGVQGLLRRDEDNRVRSIDQYVQANWELAERWSLSGGLRRSLVMFGSKDNYLSNGDNSGGVSYQANSPVLGLVFHATEQTNLYASAGKGFETPTLNELANRPNSALGLNFGLQAATSSQWEMGVKSQLNRDWHLNLAYFQARTNNEIAVLTSSGGQTTYQNVGATKRSGLEAALTGRWSDTWSSQFAATYLNAIYANNFLTCVGTSACLTPNVLVTSGNRIPGIPRASLFSDLRWQAKDKTMDAALEMRYMGQIYVDDQNANGTAPQVLLFNARLGFAQQFSNWRIKEFVRIDNLTNRVYAGSVIVNESSNRYFEPAPSRNWLIGVSAALAY